MEQHVDAVCVTGEIETKLENKYQRPTLLYAGGGDQQFVCCVY